MNRSSRLRNILNRRQDLWAESETDTSSLSDDENKKLPSNDENSQLSSSTCCFICSILPNLSNINTCQKHLALVTKSLNPTQVVYMMQPAIHNCHYRSKSKYRCRSSSSSSSESEIRHQRKKRSMTVQSSSTSSQGDLFFSPNVQSQENQAHRSDHVQARLSPSLPPSSTINTNKHYSELLLTPFLQRNSSEIDPILKNVEINSPDVIEIDSGLASSPRISLHRIVHVKDEDDVLNNTDQKKIMINMAQATEQMLNHAYPQPRILLKRICLEK